MREEEENRYGRRWRRRRSGERWWIYWESDRQSGCPKLSCADPSLPGNELERTASTCLPEDNTLTPSGISEAQRLVRGYRQSRGSWLQQLLLPPSSSSSTPSSFSRESGVRRAARTSHLATRVCCRYQREEPPVSRAEPA